MTDVSMTAASPLGSLFGEGTLGHESDSQLLGRFLRGGPGAGLAFEALMARHGPMVLSVCRQVVGDRHEAEECFQATFLILVRRAGSIRRRPSAGPWLHGVARRVSLQARAARHRRELLALQVKDGFLSTDSKHPPAEIDELGPALHAEIARLPERYRAPITACYLQGRTIAEAAVLLGCPVGTVAGRLARARVRLRDRLSRRGLAPAPAVVALPARLIRSTCHVAAKVAAGQAGRDATSSLIAELVNETLRAMLWTRLKLGAACLLLGVMTAGAVGMTQPAGPSASRQEGPERPASRAAKPTPVSTRQALRQATEAVADVPDARDRLNALMALAWTQIKTGDAEAARTSLDHAANAASMLERGDRSRARSRIAIARGHADDRPRAMEILGHARRDADELNDRDRFYCLSSITAVQAELGDLEGARATTRLFQRDWESLAPRDPARIATLFALATSHLAVGEVDDAIRTCCIPVPGFDCGWYLSRLADHAASAGNEGREGSEPPRAITPSEKVMNLAVVRRCASMAEAWPHLDEDSRSKLAVALSRLGAFAEALQIARRINPQASRVRGASLAMIANDQVHAGDIKGARRSLDESERAYLMPGDEDGVSRRYFVTSCLVAGDLDRAFRHAEQLEPKQRATMLSYIAHLKMKKGDREGGRALFQRVLIDAHRLLDSPPDEKEKRFASGREALAVAQHREHVLMDIASINAMAGAWTAAVKAIEEMPPGARSRGHAAKVIAEFRARSGDIAGAYSWARSLSDPFQRSSAIQGMAAGILDANDFPVPLALTP